MPEELILKLNHKLKMRFFVVSVLVLTAIALFTASPAELFAGLVRVNASTCHLFSDFVAVGGFGATLLNVALVLLFELIVIHLAKATITGTALAALLTTAGFAFFGTNLFNSLPIVLGVMIYSRIGKIPMRTLLLQAFMGTAIGPLISYLAYGIGLEVVLGLPLAFLIGLFIGMIIPPLSASFLRFHQGYNLYNIGFTAGIIGLMAVAVLRLYNVDVQPVSIIDTQHRTELILLLLTIFLSLLLFGLILNKGSVRQYPKLLANSGRLLSDFVVMHGSGLTLFNMGVMGLLTLGFVLILQGPVNGPVAGAMMTVAGFGALGKHPRNCIPLMLGSTIACYFHRDLRTSEAIVPILFGTTLAPMAGKYGALVGMLAGYLHIAVVGNVLPLHGGLNLYNNGFSGGFVAAVLVPLIEAGRDALARREAKAPPRVSGDE
ncbi:MAG: DUF1576 domain-containing protein [Chloroflexi bacterium]|nr:DUF1576 domain-containing protein [Chloroflexota bacterium]